MTKRRIFGTCHQRKFYTVLHITQGRYFFCVAIEISLFEFLTFPLSFAYATDFFAAFPFRCLPLDSEAQRWQTAKRPEYFYEARGKYQPTELFIWKYIYWPFRNQFLRRCGTTAASIYDDRPISDKRAWQKCQKQTDRKYVVFHCFDKSICSCAMLIQLVRRNQLFTANMKYVQLHLNNRCAETNQLSLIVT